MFAVLTAAAEAAAEAAEAAGEAAHHAKGGLPQLHVPDFAPQLFWLAAMFALLYLILSKIALPRVGEVLAERRSRIQRDLDAAATLKADTDKALADYEKALSDARANASTIARNTRDKLAAESEAERVRVEGELASKLQSAETSIAATKTKAMSAVSDIASDTAQAIIGKLIGQDVTAADVKAALTGGK
jgi:F-type H+-transporting ATPase subunit b